MSTRSSASPRGPRARLRYLVTLSVLAAAALTLFLFESIIPSPVPWMRLGLANVMTVTVLFLYGAAPALLLTGLRIVLGSLLLGTFLSPAFFLATAGGAASLAVMALARRIASPPLSIVGVSVLGAAAHNAGQILALSFLFLHEAEGLRLLPYLILSATLLGALTGLSARALAAYLNARDQRGQLITLTKRDT